MIGSKCLDGKLFGQRVQRTAQLTLLRKKYAILYPDWPM